MNSTSRAILHTLLDSDRELTRGEREAIEQLMHGRLPFTCESSTWQLDRILLTQKQAAKLLSVSRITVWRMVKDGVLTPIEILPGTFRYPAEQVFKLGSCGYEARTSQFAANSAA